MQEPHLTKMTARPTDRNYFLRLEYETMPPESKCKHFAVTVFAPEEIALLDASASSMYPEYVETVFGGMEQCPTSGRMHFQGHIACKRRIRFDTLKKWLPTAHLEAARNVHASINYAMKDDTAVDEKVQVDNPHKHWKFYDLQIELAKKWRVHAREDCWFGRADLDRLCPTVSHDEFGAQANLNLDRENKQAQKFAYWLCVGELVLSNDSIKECLPVFARPDFWTVFFNCTLKYFEVEDDN